MKINPTTKKRIDEIEKMMDSKTLEEWHRTGNKKLIKKDVREYVEKLENDEVMQILQSDGLIFEELRATGYPLDFLPEKMLRGNAVKVIVKASWIKRHYHL